MTFGGCPGRPISRWIFLRKAILATFLALGCSDGPLPVESVPRFSMSTDTVQCPGPTISSPTGCGSVVKCTRIAPDSDLANELMEEIYRTFQDGNWGEVDENDSSGGFGGALDAIDLGNMYIVHNFGGCSGASGYHDGPYIGIAASTMATDTARMRTLWHEGWSFWNGCNKTTKPCHDESWLQSMEGNCYGEFH
jgi:hypothetical protein